eukprot:SAG11_NODE_1534_length_4732_cov_1.778545_4_plen_144_part_00
MMRVRAFAHRQFLSRAPVATRSSLVITLGNIIAVEIYISESLSELYGPIDVVCTCAQLNSLLEKLSEVTTQWSLRMRDTLNTNHVSQEDALDRWHEHMGCKAISSRLARLVGEIDPETPFQVRRSRQDDRDVCSQRVSCTDPS